MRKKTILVGNGSIAEIVINAFPNHEFCAAAIERKYIKADYNAKAMPPLVALEELQEKFDPNSFDVFIAVGYVQMNRVRERLFNSIEKLGFDFCNLIHKRAQVHGSTKLGRNNMILDNVSIQPGASLGDGNFVWSNTVIAHGASVGNHNWIASGTVIGGNARCGDRSFFGVNSSVAHNVICGDETFLGSGVNCDRCTGAGDVLIAPQNYKKAPITSDRFIEFMERA